MSFAFDYFLHQAQRTRQTNKDTGEQWIETTIEDIQNANVLMKDILLKKSDRLSPALRSYFEELKAYLKSNRKQKFTNLDISLGFEKSLTTIKRHHFTLVDVGYLKTSSKKGSKTLIYQIVSPDEYDVLQHRVSSALDRALNRVKRSQMLKSRQSPKKRGKAQS